MKKSYRIRVAAVFLTALVLLCSTGALCIYKKEKTQQRIKEEQQIEREKKEAQKKEEEQKQRLKRNA